MYTKENMIDALQYVINGGGIRVFFMPYENYEYEPEYTRLDINSLALMQETDNEYLDIFVEVPEDEKEE
tara:strand:- start:522 stop:728 length:207 start_codon:yes stop_codon:yes gene_type:complete